jgi:hypothetical protein
MIYKDSIKKRSKILTTHILFLLMVTILIFYLGFNNPQIFLYLLLSYLVIFIVQIIVLIINIKNIKKQFIGKTVKVINLNNDIPYPRKFKDDFVQLSDIIKSYRYKNHQIPENFIEFKEGRTLYPYKKLTEINKDETYIVLDIHHLKYALLEDNTKKKQIVHLGNLELT